MDLNALYTFYKRDSVLLSEPMKKHTTFKIGGPASALLLPETASQIVETLSWCQDNGIPFLVMGNGSNLLVEDEGIEGVVVKISNAMADVVIDGETVVAGAGILLSALAQSAKAAELTGLEFASGIPGTLGGAVFMNAGAYGGEMKQVVEWVEVLDREGTLRRFSNEEMQFGYRTSIVRARGLIVIRVGLKLQHGVQKDIEALMADLTKRRVEKQPLEYPSAGSVFKRPEGFFAGKLIEDAGLKGLKHGGAQVSEKHCGFIINASGDATCKEVIELIGVVQKVVKDTQGVSLEREVRLFGKE
ncbi:MAG: UDP-N-acetylmuramate dehydrogenase [Clostridiales bacterium]|nr:UDP-N-acetylmuramate dehydrogenase [Clostridiales bacterium]